MATAVVSSQWRITFFRSSHIDQKTYQIDLPTYTPKTVVDAVARELRNLGYEVVAVTLTVVLP